MIHHVTQEDIDTGSPCDGNKCPVYKALSRSYPMCIYYVYSDRVEYDMKGGIHPKDRYYKALPGSVEDFIFRFDEGYPVEPFSFALEL